MKTPSLLLILVLALTPICESNAQTFSKSASEEHNYILSKQLDTMKVRFVFPSEEAMPFGDTVWMQDNIVVIMNDAPIKFFPEDLSGFCYKGAYLESLWWIEDTGTSPRTMAKHFCKRILHGTILVYAFHSVETDEEGYHRVTANLYYKKDDRAQGAMPLKSNSSISELISDCPGLSKKVKPGSKSEDFLAIIREYNSLLEPKTSH